MDKLKAITALAALGQDIRLDAFRLLIQAGQEGLAAGEIAARQKVRQNTMSANLLILHHAGLVSKIREGRSIRYYADFECIRRLLSFLLEDCCGGKKEMCQSMLQKIIQ